MSENFKKKMELKGMSHWLINSKHLKKEMANKEANKIRKEKDYVIRGKGRLQTWKVKVFYDHPYWIVMKERKYPKKTGSEILQDAKTGKYFKLDSEGKKVFLSEGLQKQIREEKKYEKELKRLKMLQELEKKKQETLKMEKRLTREERKKKKLEIRKLQEQTFQLDEGDLFS